MAFLIFSFFMREKLWKLTNPNKEPEYDHHWAVTLRKFAIRAAFILVGIPIFGILYTHSLDYLEEATNDSKLAATQIVSSTFVNFGDWARMYRLAPLDGMTLESSPTTTLSGEGAVSSFRSLRSTAVALNKATGMLPSSYTPSFNRNILTANSAWFTTEDAGKDDNSLWQKTLSVLLAYSKDGRYYASDWESNMSRAAADSGINMGRRKGSVEEDFDEDYWQGETTYYNLADSTNEYDDWNERTDDENDEITTGSKWGGFNIFANGGLTVSSSGSGVEGATVAYTGSTSHKLTSPSTTGGLSTLSMYNYLSSRFSSKDIKIYSNTKSANDVQKYSHRLYSIIGGPGLSGLFYINCLVVLMVGAVLALVYGLMMIINNVKKGCQVLVSIPGAMLGAISSIATFVMAVAHMIINVMVTIFMYSIFSDLTLFIVNVMEGLLRDMGVNGTILGGITMTMQDISLSRYIATETKIGFGVVLACSTVFLLAFGYILLRYRSEFFPALCAVQEKLLLMGLPEVVQQRAKEQWQAAPVRSGGLGYAMVLLRTELFSFNDDYGFAGFAQ